MEINVSQLLKSSIGAVRDYDINESIGITGDGDDSQVEGSVQLTRTDRGILVKGTLDTEAELTCSRCLILFNCPLKFNIEEEFFPTADIISGASLDVPDEPGCFTIDEHFILDLTEAVRQCALLSSPMKPLCKDECVGLCPVCGRNLNQGRCDCRAEEIDPRWSKLAKLASAGDDFARKE